MNDHTDMQIPDDVMEAANRCVSEFRWNNDSQWHIFVARAIFAERERCARIAEAEWVWPNTAAAIRRSVDK